MSLIHSSIRDLVAFKLKNRSDGVTDQFSRIFMPKLFVMSSVIMGINLFNDRVNCIVSSKTDLSVNFVHATCWITEFYVYEEMHERIQESAYYGIPENIDYDGVDENGYYI